MGGGLGERRGLRLRRGDHLRDRARLARDRESAEVMQSSQAGVAHEGRPKVSKRLHHQAQERQTQGRARQPYGTLQQVSPWPFARPFRLLAAPIRTLPSEAEAVEVRNSRGLASLSTPV